MIHDVTISTYKRQRQCIVQQQICSLLFKMMFYLLIRVHKVILNSIVFTDLTG